MMKRLLPLSLLLVASVVAAADQPLQISASEWAQPRSGSALLRHPVLNEAVQQLLHRPQGVLEIRYPGGDSGSLWAREVQAWLVALGIESSRIRTLPGSESADLLQLRVR